jgi:hypothetical protein
MDPETMSHVTPSCVNEFEKPLCRTERANITQELRLSKPESEIGLIIPPRALTGASFPKVPNFTRSKPVQK